MVVEVYGAILVWPPIGTDTTAVGPAFESGFIGSVEVQINPLIVGPLCFKTQMSRVDAVEP